MPAKREHWSSRAGFILATIGSAVGLGNIWRFPTIVGREGGGAFVLLYLAAVLLIGLPAIIGELALGRRAQRNVVGAFRVLSPGTGWWPAGAVSLLAGIMILSFYSVVAGWTLVYTVRMTTGQLSGFDVTSLKTAFASFTADPYLPLFSHALFMGLTILIVATGIQKGIERWGKILIPGILFILLLLMFRALTLPGAVLTYGSYLGPEENIPQSSLYIAFADVAIAMIAGFTVLPAVFAFGLEPEIGPGLIFISLPAVFNTLPGGNWFGGAFFLMIGFAALTSSIALLEIPVAFLRDELRCSRSTATIYAGTAIFLLCVPSALSWSLLSSLRLGNRNFFDFIDFFSAGLLLPLGGLLTVLFLGWVWGAGPALKELEFGAGQFPPAGIWSFLIKYLVPAAIAIIMFTALLPAAD